MPTDMKEMRQVIEKLMPAEANESFVIHAGKVLTGKREGDRVLQDQAVLVEDGRITSVSDWSSFQSAGGVKVVDASSKTVTPGLIEGHVHITGEWPHNAHGTHLAPFLETRALRGILDVWAVFTTGYTTMVSMGHGHPSVVGSIKRMIDREGFPGPRVYHPGWSLSQSAGHGTVRDWDYGLVKDIRPRSTFVDGPVEIRKQVRENLGQGADFIKFYANEGGPDAAEYIGRRQNFSVDEVRTITDEAHRMGFRVAAHCVGTKNSAHAAENGVDRIEHGEVLYNPEYIPMLKATGAAWCPTLSQLYWRLQEREARGYPPEMIHRLEQSVIDRCQMIQEGLDQGVTIGFGTDIRMRPKAGRNANELKMMVDNGLSNLDVISIATQLAARMVGLEEQLGTVEQGKLADLLIIDGDPESDITVFSDVPGRVETIIKSYQHVNPTAVTS